MYEDNEVLEYHIEEEHSGPVCSICGIYFKNSKALYDHKGSHLSELKYECELCGIQMKSTQDVLEHYMKVHQKERDPPEFSCSQCNKTYRQKKTLNKHFKDCHGIDSDSNKFKCDICDYRGKSKDQLKGHISWWHKRKCFQCRVCNRKFVKVSFFIEKCIAKT